MDTIHGRGQNSRMGELFGIGAIMMVVKVKTFAVTGQFQQTGRLLQTRSTHEFAARIADDIHNFFDVIFLRTHVFAPQWRRQRLFWRPNHQRPRKHERIQRFG